MNDTELFALAVLVQASALGMRSFDEDRLRHGLAVGYGDMCPEGHDQLHAELRKRGILARRLAHSRSPVEPQHEKTV